MTITPESFTPDKLIFTKPTKNSNEKYVSKVMYGKGELLIQTPRMSCKVNKTDRMLSLYVDDECFYNFLGLFDEHIIQTLHNNSLTWFEQDLSEQTCNDIYRRSVESPFKMGTNNKMNIKIKNAYIYMKKNEKCEIEDLNANEEVICLLRCSHLVFYRSYCVPYWEAIQIKIKDNTLSYDNYRIKDLDDDDTPVVNDEIQDNHDDITDSITDLKIDSE
jgi:hypothetical protein